MWFKIILLVFLISGILSAIIPSNTTTTTTTTTTSTEHPIYNFTRSRYSGRRSTKAPTTITTTTTAIPITKTTESSISITTASIKLKKNLTKDCGVRIGDNQPWIAIIEHTNPSDSRSKRTLSKGALIHPQFVLTTVSSIHHSYPFWVVSAVRLGDPLTYQSTPKNKSAIVRVDIEQVFLHALKDIALIKLTTPVNYTDLIQPICLPTNTNYNYRELFLHMCKRQGIHRDISLSSVLPIAPQDCLTLFQRQNSEFSSDEFCAWDENGDDCAGDIGGPLIGQEDGRYHVIGLNSFANFKEESNIEGLPGVYTRVGSYLNWINGIMNQTLSKNIVETTTIAVVKA